MSGSKQAESPSTSWLTGMIGMDALSFAKWLRSAQALDGRSVDETAEAHVKEGAKLDELVYAQLALTVQDVPESLSVHADAAAQLGHTDTPLMSPRLDEGSCVPAVFYEHGALFAIGAPAISASSSLPIAEGTRILRWQAPLELPPAPHRFRQSLSPEERTGAMPSRPSWRKRR